MVAARLKELLKKYGKVGFGVHCSVSAVSVSGLYLAIKNNVDVESMLEKIGMPGIGKEKNSESSDLPSENAETATRTTTTDSVIRDDQTVKVRNKTAELAASSGGALALAVLINKALFPVRVPITLALTPPVARFLAKRNLIKMS